MSVLDIIIKYQEGLRAGLLVTLELCLIIWASGLIVGTIIGFSSSRSKSVGGTSRTIAFVLSGVPALVLLFWLHYPLQQILGIVVDPFITATLALSLINIFAVSEIVRTALVEFPNQYIVAGRVCGLSDRAIFKKIELPIVFRQIIPGILTLQVAMLQLTLFASFISVEEIFRVAQRINSVIYKPVEIYTALAILFLIVCLPLNGLAIYLKNKYTRNLSEK